MLNDLRDLEPKDVFSYFADFCAIPRVSGHEQGVADYLMRFAAEHHLQAVTDAAGNVIIDKPASQGRENSPRIIVQGHQDMVPAKRPGSTHDFAKDPITPVIRGGRIYADGTSLGADDGIGMALALAFLADDTLEHGPLRAIFTVQEETTMKGAASLAPEYLDADYLLNLDSEEDGYVFIASAGSQDLEVTFKAAHLQDKDDADAPLAALSLTLTDLSGGHSGTDIHLGRANAIVLLSSLLLAQSGEFERFYLMNLKGGSVRNAIPSSACFTVALPKDDVKDFKQALLIEFEKYRQLYHDTDPKMRLEMAEVTPGPMLSFADSVELLSLIENLPHGPERPFPQDMSIVETSCNLGLISTDGDTVTIGLMARSLNDFALDKISDKVGSLCFLSDKTELSAPHREACWQSKADTPLIEALCRSYEELTGRKMQVTALHAGLETAAFAAKNPKLQLASLGPTVTHPHSADESCDIQAVQTAYQMLRRTLAVL